ncbi:MAG: phosphoribosylanthranilate isomerase [Victivallaceae bacterium]
MKLKICGLTNAEDVKAAIAAGAEYLGFIFHPASPRYVAPEKVKELVKDIPPKIKKVGVFVNLQPEKVIELMTQCDLDIAQLHGNETAEDARKIGIERVWKVLDLKSAADIERAAAFPAAAILVDSRTATQYGGTGKVCDWSLAAEAAKKVKLILAGGLSPENIVDAAEQVKPFMLDVNSGVESAPGIKNHEKLKQLAAKLKFFRTELPI